MTGVDQTGLQATASEQVVHASKSELEDSALALIEWDRTQGVAKWTSRAEQIFGWTCDEVAGKRWDEIPFVHSDDLERVRRLSSELIEGEKDYNTVLNRNLRKDGTLVHCEWFNSVRRDQQGNIVAFVSLVHDVTHRVLSEQRAQQMRNAMRQIVEGTSRFTGKRFYEALVRQLATTLGFRYSMLVVADEKPSEKATKLACWVSGALRESTQFEIRGTAFETIIAGEECEYEDRVRDVFPDDPILRELDAKSLLGCPLIDSQGNVFGLLAILHDRPMEMRPDIRQIIALFADRAAIEIQRARTEQSLIDSEVAFRRLIEHAPEAVVLLDTETQRFIMVNPAAESLYRLTAEKLYQLGPIEMSPPTQPDGRRSDQVATEMIQMACAGETPIFEWTHRNADGHDVPCEIRLLALHDHGKTVVRGSITDVSEKKRAEESLKRLESELSHVSRVSTMGELVGGLAHELNQPLYAIQNYGKACGNLVADQREFDREQLRSWLSEISATAQSAGEILMRLRNFVSRKPMKKEASRLDELIDSAITLTRYDAQKNRIRIESNVPESLPLVHADSVQIQQVLVNLLRNAFDATIEKSHGSPAVQIRAEYRDGFVNVAVTDNGPGLPPDSQNIFDAFASTKPQGLGLGLAISKTIVEEHGGQLTANNIATGGAEFCFTLVPAG